MVRVMTGDALVGEHERLQSRMNQFYERFEATLKQALRQAQARSAAEGQKTADAEVAAQAGMLMRYAIGCLHLYAKSGFAKKPTEAWAAQRRLL